MRDAEHELSIFKESEKVRGGGRDGGRSFLSSWDSRRIRRGTDESGVFGYASKGQDHVVKWGGGWGMLKRKGSLCADWGGQLGSYERRTLLSFYREW